jgi:hypothetical protein
MQPPIFSSNGTVSRTSRGQRLEKLGGRRVALRTAVVVLAIGLVSCTAIPLDQLEKASQTGGASGTAGTVVCSELQNLVDLDPTYQPPAENPPPPGAASPHQGTFQFLLPAGQLLGIAPGAPFPGSGVPAPSSPKQNVADFDDFQKALEARLKDSDLSPEIKKHAVTKTIFNVLVKSFAQAQLDRAKASGYDTTPQQLKVDKVSTSRIGLRDLKGFTEVVQDSQFHPKIVPPAQPPPPGATAKPTQNTFATYFVDYYEGNFYDRLGNAITKPTISAQIPDSDISSALSVLIEYLIDLIDPTPVLGDQDLDSSTNKPPDNTQYYPTKSGAKSTHAPEALKAGLSNYKNIANNKCGVTTKNAVVLYDAASAAGDSVSAVSGLVSQSWGGVGVSFVGFLKFSIGDNQTLGIIVKTAASRVASRAALASAYWALDRIGAIAPAPGAAPVAPPPGAVFPSVKPSATYLKFND